MVKLDGDKAIKVLRLIDELDELDDVQHVYSNLDVSEEVLEKYAKE
jgi:transcriptional/translational regulatory protein YebC/TACO1